MKIVCVGRNYVGHIDELDNQIPKEMVLFMKPASAMTDVLCSSHAGEQLQYEGELCFECHHGRLSRVGFGLDLTKRDLQTRLKDAGLPWERSKAFDGSALFSVFVDVQDAIADLRIELECNGVVVQSAGTELMLYSPQSICAEVGRIITIDDDDIIMTGTPKGVGVIRPGDRFIGRVLAGDREIVSQTWIAS